MLRLGGEMMSDAESPRAAALALSMALVERGGAPTAAAVLALGPQIPVRLCRSVCGSPPGWCAPTWAPCRAIARPTAGSRGTTSQLLWEAWHWPALLVLGLCTWGRQPAAQHGSTQTLSACVGARPQTPNPEALPAPVARAREADLQPAQSGSCRAVPCPAWPATAAPRPAARGGQPAQA